MRAFVRPICPRCRRLTAFSTRTRRIHTEASALQGLYTLTTPPRDIELSSARAFFSAHPARHLGWHERFFSLPLDSGLPEIAFLGRSNAGKSSLLNALLRGKNNHQSTKKRALSGTSRTPGRTRAMHAFLAGLAAERHVEGWKDLNNRVGGVVVLDMPGYGHASKREWGAEITKYLAGRKQLRRVFLLLPAHHKPTALDVAVLDLLHQHGVSHQLILTKTDRMKRGSQEGEKKLRDTLNLGVYGSRDGLPGRHARPHFIADVLTTSCTRRSGGLADKESGIDELRWAVLQATGVR